MKALKYISILALALIELVSCEKPPQEIVISSISLNQTSASLKVGETVTLTATVKPDDATNKTVTWSTSDASASVATVENGVVTAKMIGTATITAKAGDKTATCAITVTSSVTGKHEGTSEEDW